MIDKYWMDFVTDVCKANARRTISITGSLAIAMGGWLLLNATTKGPAEFFNSMQTIYAVQLMAIGGVAQHTKATRRQED